jgi:biotin carboxyl carrier protein
MIRLKKNKKFVVSGENTFTLKTQDYKLVSSRIQKEKFTLQKNDDNYMVSLNNKHFVGEVAELKQNKCTVIVNGNTYSFTIDTEASFKRKEGLKENNQLKLNQNIEAPMPGKITEILIAQGSQVEKGTALLLLEAMKMQNQIISQQAGTVGKIRVRAGESVMVNQVLIEME